MAEYITKQQVLEWFRPYGHADEPIPFETLVSDLRDCIPAADVAPVKHGRWEEIISPYGELEGWICECGRESNAKDNYCPNCGAKMDGGPDVEAD